MNRMLVCIGIACIAAGLLWPWLRTFPLGRLPGDIVIVREHFRLYLPLASSILISLLVSILFWLFRK
jgi:hypothetical protein